MKAEAPFRARPIERSGLGPLTVSIESFPVFEKVFP